MIRIGQPFPQYSLTEVVANDLDKAFRTYDHTADAGRWKIFFWPWTSRPSARPRLAFGRLDRQFRDRDAQLYGVSTDSEFVHLAWRKSHEDLRNLPFPMLST